MAKFPAKIVAFDNSAETQHVYTVTPADASGVVRRLLPAVVGHVQTVVPEQARNDTVRQITRWLRGAVNTAGNVNPRVTLWHTVQGSCDSLDSATIRLASHELDYLPLALNTTIQETELAMAISASFEAVDLDYRIERCRTSGGRPGRRKSQRFLYRFAMRFTLMVGPLTLSPELKKNDDHWVRTQGCPIDTDATKKAAKKKVAKKKVAKRKV
jgi:hypothetical protein